MREAEYAIFADKHNWKYAWFGEHHCLTEYSHMSAPEVVMGYVAGQTDYIHLSLRHQQPVARARSTRSAAPSGPRCSTTSPIAASSGAPAVARAATRWPASTSWRQDSTKPEWEEVVREIPRMWEQEDYQFEGDHFTVPTPHNVLPKPYGDGHPPIWVACGNPPTFARAGELGIGAIAFNFEPIFNLKGRIDAYKEAIAGCTEPIGQFKNDNVMMTNAVICFEDRKKARQLALERVRGYLVTMVNLYHDTMPKSPDAITWPGAPVVLEDLVGTGDPDELLDQLIAGGMHARRQPGGGQRADRVVQVGGLRPAGLRDPRRHAPRRGPRDDRALR